MRTSQTGIDLIKKFEGFRSKAYLCPSKVPTIGYGTTQYAPNIKVKMGDTITEADAEKYLRQDVRVFEEAINRAVKTQLSQEQFDALVSFVYNVGINAFVSSTMLTLINQNLLEQAANEFPRWNRGSTGVLQGLIIRRKAEKDLFMSARANPRRDVTWIQLCKAPNAIILKGYKGSELIEEKEISKNKTQLIQELESYINAFTVLIG